MNHHLLCADAALRQNAFGEVIPACSRAIVDEAHQLEDVATQYFGYSISNYRVEDLARDVERLGRGRRGWRWSTARGARTGRREPARLRAERFSPELTFAHRGSGRVESRGAGASDAGVAR